MIHRDTNKDLEYEALNENMERILDVNRDYFHLTLSELGYDSLDYLGLTEDLEETFGVDTEELFGDSLNSRRPVYMHLTPKRIIDDVYNDKTRTLQ